MIKNERQYRITKAQVERFSEALDELEGETAEGLGVHPLLFKARKDAVRSQLADLEEELREYERLKYGDFEFGRLDAVADVPHLLIRARIARGLSQKSLAGRLGLKEQQIQRYEASEYASASLARVLSVAVAVWAFEPLLLGMRPR